MTLTSPKPKVDTMEIPRLEVLFSIEGKNINCTYDMKLKS